MAKDDTGEKKGGKKKMIIIAVVAVAALGGGGYFFMGGGGGEPAEGEAAVTTTTEPQEGAVIEAGTLTANLADDGELKYARVPKRSTSASSHVGSPVHANQLGGATSVRPARYRWQRRPSSPSPRLSSTFCWPSSFA